MHLSYLALFRHLKWDCMIRSCFFIYKFTNSSLLEINLIMRSKLTYGHWAQQFGRPLNQSPPSRMSRIPAKLATDGRPWVNPKSTHDLFTNFCGFVLSLLHLDRVLQNYSTYAADFPCCPTVANPSLPDSFHPQCLRTPCQRPVAFAM